MPLCPKCNAPLPDWIDADDTLTQHARYCAINDCPYVSCDDLRCRALKTPVTLDQWREAAEHWRTHTYLSGCSHAR